MKKFFSTSVLLILLLSFILPNEVIAQKGKYKKACQANTIDSYQGFLTKYPDSEYSKDIKERLINLEYEQVKDETQPEPLKEFLKKYPDNQYSEQIKPKIENLEFAIVEKSNSVLAYARFVEQHPEGEIAISAKDKINELIAKTIILIRNESGNYKVLFFKSGTLQEISITGHKLTDYSDSRIDAEIKIREEIMEEIKKNEIEGREFLELEYHMSSSLKSMMGHLTEPNILRSQIVVWCQDLKNLEKVSFSYISNGQTASDASLNKSFKESIAVPAINVLKRNVKVTTTKSSTPLNIQVINDILE